MCQIRLYRPGDEVGISVAHARSIQEICAADYSAEQISSWVARISPQRYVDSVAKNSEQFWVIDDVGRIGGFASWYGERILNFYIHPEFIGRGLGRKLFSIAEHDFWIRGKKSSSPIESTLTARPFYERMGYKSVRPDARTLDNGIKLPTWHLTKDRPSNLGRSHTF